MLLNCTHKCWGDHFHVILLFLTKTNNKSPSCSPSASIQWVDCILFSQVSSLLLLTYPEAVGTQAGQSIGFNRVTLRGCWARSSVPDWEHTELVRVHQGTENTQSSTVPVISSSRSLEPYSLVANMSIIGHLVPYPSYLSRGANKDHLGMDVYSEKISEMWMLLPWRGLRTTVKNRRRRCPVRPLWRRTNSYQTQRMECTRERSGLYSRWRED